MKLTKDRVKKEFHLNLKGKTAVFIDAANIELSAKDLGFRVDYKKLLKRHIKPVFYNGRLITVCFQTAI